MSEFAVKGTVFGGTYEIVKPIAKGGYSIVYLAKRIGTDEAVALKLLERHENMDKTWLERFRQEARVIKNLHHPNTVRIYDCGEDKGFLYIAMEFIRGRSLYRQIRKYGPMDPQHVAQIALMVCNALEETHAQGVLHRDIKPSNIMLSDTDNGFKAKILDFGSAKLTKPINLPIFETAVGAHKVLSKLTQQGVFVGTPRYASPEQLLQNPVDQRVDIYGLGMVMWEALVGDPAVSELDYAQCIEKHLGPHPWMLPLSLNTPPLLANIVHRSLQKAKEDRYFSMRELADALSLFLQSDESNTGSLMSISESSDPLIHDPLEFGDITGMDDSEIPILEPKRRPESGQRRAYQPTKKYKSPSQIGSMENLELDRVLPLPKREPNIVSRPIKTPPKPIRKSIIFGVMFGLFGLFSLGYFWSKDSRVLKWEIESQLEEKKVNASTLDRKFIANALRTTGWIVRLGDPLPYRDGVKLSTLRANKKGLEASLSIFECTNHAQVKELDQLTDGTKGKVSFGSTFVRWNNSESGSDLLQITLSELEKLNQNNK